MGGAGAHRGLTSFGMGSGADRLEDGLDPWRLQELLWSIRWLAADPEAALTAIPNVVVADEIALDLEHWTLIARQQRLVDAEVLVALDEFDATFDAMTDAGRPELWTDDAVAHAPEWSAQRDRARRVLAMLGASRLDEELGTPRPGGPTSCGPLLGVESLDERSLGPRGLLRSWDSAASSRFRVSTDTRAPAPLLRARAPDVVHT